MGLNSRKGSQHQQDSATGINAPQLLGYIFFASLGSKFKVPREGGTEWLFGLIHHDCTRVERDSSSKGKQDARLENEEKVLSNHNWPQLLPPLHHLHPPALTPPTQTLLGAFSHLSLHSYVHLDGV